MGRETPVAAQATRSARRRNAALLAIGAVVPAAVAAALSPARDHVAPQTIALVLVLVVVTIAAAVGRHAVAVAAGLSAAIGFDYFHTRPYGSLSITRSEDVQTALLLLVTAILVGELGAWGRRHRDTAAQLAGELAAVSRVAALLGATETSEAVVAAVSHELRNVLALRDCWFDPNASADETPSLDRDGGVLFGRLQWRVDRDGLPGPRVSLPVRRRACAMGRYVLTPTAGLPVPQHARRCAVVLAAMTASALDEEASE